jgi:hypothetical protein
MKVALCFIISYKHILNKEQLWINWIKENKDIINVYFHYKDINQIQSPWIKMHTIPPKYVHQTTYYSIVPAYISLLSYAFHHDLENKWFCMLTDSCVPIISPAKFRKLFFENYRTSIFKWKPAYWNITIHRRANLRLLKKEYWLANDPWFTLSRAHVHKCILFLVAKNDIYKQVNSGGLANESIFAIMLQTFNELSNPSSLINAVNTVTDWSRMSSPTSPYVFKEATEENINIITNLLKENSNAMFLRKVDREFPDQAILDLYGNENIYINDKSSQLQLIVPYKHGYYMCIISFLNLLSGIYSLQKSAPDFFTIYLTGFITSINYWRHPTYGFRRNVDMSFVVLAFIYSLFKCIMINKLKSYFITSIIVSFMYSFSKFCYNNNYIWTSTIIHSLIHVSVNMHNMNCIQDL